LRGLNETRMFDSAHFAQAIRMRLGSQCAPAHATCQLVGLEGDDVCGEPLLGRPLKHTCICVKGAARHRPHHAVKQAYASVLRRDGATVDVERHVPQLYYRDPAGHVVEAILDLVAVWPGQSKQRHIDVTLSCPLADRNAAIDPVPGAAAMIAERRKLKRYGEDVMPMAFESFGRIGPQSLAHLRTLACEAAGHQRSALEPTPPRRMARMRGEIERVLLFYLADAALLCLGSACAPVALLPTAAARASLVPDDHPGLAANTLLRKRARRARAVVAGSVAMPPRGARP
jgi:hypothetical protein